MDTIRDRIDKFVLAMKYYLNDLYIYLSIVYKYLNIDHILSRWSKLSIQ